MTGMLASVTTIAEAEIALQANVDIIDIKNPHEGALGALEINGVKDIVRKVNRVVPTSATIGDIKPDDPDLFKYILDMSDTGVDYVKVGLFENKISDNFIKVISNAAKNINLVVVLFAENYLGESSIEPFLKTGIANLSDMSFT